MSLQNAAVITSLVFSALTLDLHAAVLMLDFGPTASTGAETNSPYHTVNGTFTDTVWNPVETADQPTLSWSDGTAATGVSLNLGATIAATTASSTLLLGSTPSGSSALGTVVTAGVYAGNSVGKDGIFTGSGTRAVGFQLSGLAAGSYDLYITARNTSAGAHEQNLYVATSATSGNFVINAPGSTTKLLSFSGGTAATASWSEDANYLKFSVTLGTGEVLNLASLGGTGEGRGFLNSVEIVSVPEPGVTGLFVIGLAGLWFQRLRRRTSE